MANTFKNYVATCSDDTQTTVYTVPGSTTAVVIGANVSNTGAAQLAVDVQLGSTYVVKDAPIPAGSALSVLDGKIIAEAAEVISVTSSDASGNVDVILSVLEQS